MKTKKQIEIQLKSYRTRRDNIMRENWAQNAPIIFRLNEKIDALKWVLGIVE